MPIPAEPAESQLRTADKQTLLEVRRTGRISRDITFRATTARVQGSETLSGRLNI